MVCSRRGYCMGGRCTFSRLNEAYNTKKVKSRNNYAGDSASMSIAPERSSTSHTYSRRLPALGRISSL
jgi:hypothetical protein